MGLIHRFRHAIPVATAAVGLSVAHVAPSVIPGVSLSGTAPHGTERWAVKVSVPAQTDLTRSVAVPIDDLLRFPDPSPQVAKNDPSFNAARIPQFPNPEKIQEGDIVSTTGWLHLVAGETDGDFHIQISDSLSSGDNCLIVEVPNPQTISVSPDSLRTNFATVRSYILQNILHSKPPSSSGTLIAPPVQVRVTGQLFYDDAHVGDPPRGKKGMHAATLWEIHPVTAIAVAP